MTAWTTDELRRIERAHELQIAPLRPDGKLREPVTIWVVRHGDDLYVRSYRGEGGGWYRGTQARHEGHIRSGGVDRDVAFIDETDAETNAAIDTAYRSKYSSYGDQYVEPMLAPAARATTLKLLPR